MSELSRQTGTGVSTVEDIASQYSERMKSDIISGEFTRLSMDELYASKNIGYYWVLNDISQPDCAKNIMIEIGRKKEDVVLCLRKLKNLESIEAVCIDMWEPYKNAINTAIPNADVCIDPFHVVKNASKALNDIRKSTDFGSKKENKKAKKDSYLFTSSIFKLSGAELDRLDSYLGKSEVLANAYFSYQEILYFYKIEGYNEATDYILNWIIDTSELNIPALNKVVATTAKWLFEILNHFKHHISNGKTEGKNRLIRMIERMGFHYGHKTMQAAIYAHDARQAKLRKHLHINKSIKEAVENSGERVAA
ncbi:MAG: transposase [Clostridiales bacterium]|jgi:transposase|nr:transposase [Clostridiales bacterium]